MKMDLRGAGDTPKGYANALLTTLAKVPPTSVTITPGPGVPALAPLATDPDELEWISSLPFKYDAIDGTRVVLEILNLAGWHFWQGPRVHQLNVFVAGPDGQMEQVRFHVDRRWRTAGPITVTRVAITSTAPETNAWYST
jgi:hypothetical protein